MREYEIRVLKKDRSLSMAMLQRHLNNDTAIEEARRISAGKVFEVWCDAECIHGSGDDEPLHFAARK